MFKVIETRYFGVRESVNKRKLEFDKQVIDHREMKVKCQGFLDWVIAAKEELDRWSEAGKADKESIQKKINKIRVTESYSLYLKILMSLIYFRIKGIRWINL